MNGSKNTIGLSDLLDEVSHHLDDFRKKHNDYSVKNITMWWEMERERLEMRHRDVRVMLKIRPRRLWLFAGASLVMFASGLLTAFSIR